MARVSRGGKASQLCHFITTLGRCSRVAHGAKHVIQRQLATGFGRLDEGARALVARSLGAPLRIAASAGGKRPSSLFWRVVYSVEHGIKFPQPPWRTSGSPGAHVTGLCLSSQALALIVFGLPSSSSIGLPSACRRGCGGIRRSTLMAGQISRLGANIYWCMGN